MKSGIEDLQEIGRDINYELKLREDSLMEDNQKLIKKKQNIFENISKMKREIEDKFQDI